MSSESSSSYGRIKIYNGDTFIIREGHVVSEFEFIGGSNSIATIIIIENPFRYAIANIGGQFVWDYQGLNEHIFTIPNESISFIVRQYQYTVTYDGIGSLLFTISLLGLVSGDVLVAMASRQYGEGRIFIHTDRLGGVQTGHGDNPKEFWRKILEWTSNKKPQEMITAGLVINTKIHSADKLNSFNPINVKRFSISDLATADLSNIDCLYVVGLPDSVSSVVSQRIKTFVENGGGLIIEYPNRGNEYINILSDIENVYCYSSERPIQTLAYWTIDGSNSLVCYEDVDIAFMSEMRQVDFSNEWTILMTNIVNTITTTTTTSLEDAFDFDQSNQSEFSISLIVAMQKGIVTIYEGESSSSSSSSVDSSSSSSDV